MFVSKNLGPKKFVRKKLMSNQIFGSKDFGFTKLLVQKFYRVPKKILSKKLRLAKNWVPNVWSKLGQ